ncbi:MAG TPA: hypothetical protein PKE55_12380 [Kiritimatiellia bacterium]|nr:hypothetical protein [Kiritimatiellia bacterium]
MDGPRILIWIAIVLLIDAAIGLAGLNRFQKLAPTVPIKAIAIGETLLAILLFAGALLWRHG